MYKTLLVCFPYTVYFTDTILMISEYVDSGLVGCENINMYVW